MRAYVDLSSGRRLGHIKKYNVHTIWVRIMMGAKTFITVKRHKIKHNVTIIGG
jgi:hypothetical protein